MLFGYLLPLLYLDFLLGQLGAKIIVPIVCKHTHTRRIRNSLFKVLDQYDKLLTNVTTLLVIR